MTHHNTIPPKIITEALHKGLTYLLESQQADGQFITLAGPPPRLEPPTAYSVCVYTTTFVVHSVAWVQAHSELGLSPRLVADLAQLQARASEFLLAQQNPTGNWTYNGPSETRIPPDLDDTACAIAALYLAELAGAGAKPEPLVFASLLWQNEAAPGGPYYTWFGVNESDDPRAKDIDGLVNANILYCAGLLNLSLTPTAAFLKDLIESETYAQHNRYGLSSHFLGYCLSRASEVAPDGPLQTALPHLQAYTLRQHPQPTQDENALNLALSTATLLNTHAPREQIQPYLTALLRHQQADGRWPAWAAYAGYGHHADGSPALSTAVAVEALAKWLVWADKG